MNHFNDPIFDRAKLREKEYFKLLLHKVKPSQQRLYTCHKCKSTNITSVSKQVRSADESSSVFNRCGDCGNKWRDG